MAPEIVARSQLYTKSVDIWAAGVVCYDCLVGATIFNPRHKDAPAMANMDQVQCVLYKIQRWKE